MLRRRLALLGVIFGAWTAVALLFALQTYLYRAFADRPIPFRDALVAGLVEYWFWAAVTPLVLWLCAHKPIQRGLLGRRILLYVAVGIAISVLMALYRLPMFDVVYPTVPQNLKPPPGVLFQRYLTLSLHTNMWLYWAIVALAHLANYARRYRDREIAAAQLQTQLAQAQLQVLRMQLQPHFLFNTLHSISALMHRDVEAADRMLAQLSDLLRLSLERGGAQEVSLKEELEFLERYVEIEKTRFLDRLTVAMHIDPETLDASVPSLILQPLVENAVRHGIAKRAAPGHIEVRAARQNGRLRLSVQDDGPGLPEEGAGEARSGLGLRNTRARLERLYGEAHAFRLRNLPGGGVLVELSFPFLAAGLEDLEAAGKQNATAHV